MDGGAVEKAAIVGQTLTTVGVAWPDDLNLQSSDRMCGRRHGEK